jgi:hypothetical protein
MRSALRFHISGAQGDRGWVAGSGPRADVLTLSALGGPSGAVLRSIAACMRLAPAGDLRRSASSGGDFSARGRPPRRSDRLGTEHVEGASPESAPVGGAVAAQRAGRRGSDEDGWEPSRVTAAR